ncbi:hypothetical protein [Alkalimarinus alittae]|uniref:Uncharacterized protein n=1 Tax=Alkalimarinus alittae TaxID=2961619 RepID=A0ABY6MZ16_9ALTE|nr:hypothetical protein [Alkalimarinus alittae]UZE95027.1 hypothetical protein NKI27_13235 [Alkalimarinus alittae]
MNSWFTVDLGDALLSHSRLDELQSTLSEMYEQAGRPANMVAFYRHQSTGLHCHLILFLTSEFQRIAMLDHAVQCYAPNASGLSYLAGDRDGLIEP